MLLDKILKFFIVAITAIAGAALMNLASPHLSSFIGTEVLKMHMGIFKMTLAALLCVLFGALAGGAVGAVLAPFCVKRLKRLALWVEQQLNKLPIHDVIAGVVGLAIGLILANLLGAAFSKVPLIGDYVPMLFSLVLGYLGVHIMIKKRSDIVGMFDFIPRFFRDYLRQREKVAEMEAEAEKSKEHTETIRLTDEETAAIISALSAIQQQNEVEKPQYKLLDTSAIIDGRIADICITGFVEGTLLIPIFVLQELQHIADSSDALKRARGRRGLDILQRLQSSPDVKVEIDDRDYEDLSEVDAKLVRLGKETGGKIITNDFNLNKVSELQGVKVLNINELANAIKPIVIPGETMTVSVVKHGKEHGQGLAYLDDGTMIVIENGNRHLNSTINVEVTSALQTAAGRMIFAKPIAS